jgi:hypothetical protein
VGQGAVGGRGPAGMGGLAAGSASFPGFKLLVYDRWMARGGDWVRKESWTYHLQGRSDVCAVAKFLCNGSGCGS